jgi:hypothetical protein
VDITDKYRSTSAHHRSLTKAPCLVAVENEEVGSPFVSGSASDYLAELGAAIDVAHPLGIPVTNGGIVSGVTALLTWQDLSQHSGKPAADDLALTQTVNYFENATGHRVMTHEIGQYNVDPSVVTGHLQTLARLGTPIVIWFDADGDPAFGLHDAPGVLRRNGHAYRAQATAS